jgi:hypothetical protein
MKTAITRAKVGVDLWIAISVLSVASSRPVDAADDLVVSVVASCEAMLKEYCPGAYGFRITESGVFVASLSPEGGARNGQAVGTPLFALARRALADPANSSVACPMLGLIPGTRETVTVSLKDKTLVLRGGGAREGSSRVFEEVDSGVITWIWSGVVGDAFFRECVL